MLWHPAKELLSAYGKWDPSGRAGSGRERWFTELPSVCFTFLRTSIVGGVEINWRWIGASEMYLGIRNLKYIHFSDALSFMFTAKSLSVINQDKSWELNSLWRWLNCPAWLSVKSEELHATVFLMNHQERKKPKSPGSVGHQRHLGSCQFLVIHTIDYKLHEIKSRVTEFILQYFGCKEVFQVPDALE